MPGKKDETLETEVFRVFKSILKKKERTDQGRKRGKFLERMEKRFFDRGTFNGFEYGDGKTNQRV